jgi:hypothetical protein
MDQTAQTAASQVGQSVSLIEDPEFKNLIPRLSATEREGLESAIIRDGRARDAIIIWGGHNIIVDGHNRHEICTANRLPFRTEEMSFEDRDEAKAWVITNQLARRNIGPFARVQLASKLAGLRLAAKARANMATGRGNLVTDPFRSRDEIATLAGVGHNTVSAVKKTEDRGIPALISAALSNQVSPHMAAQISDFDEADQETLVESVSEKGEKKLAGEMKALKRQREKEAREAMLFAQRDTVRSTATGEKADALDWLKKWDNESVDLLLTDPPYSTDVTDIDAFAAAWLPLALSKLKTTGRAYIFIGAYWPEIMAYGKVISGQTDFLYDDPLVWTYRNTIGPCARRTYKKNWQMILHIYGKDAPDLHTTDLLEAFSVQEFSAPDGRHGNRFHPWQKPDDLGEMFVRHGSNVGDIFIDPFMGTGTFVLVAAKLGRIAYGCDKSEGTLAIAERRGCKIIK